jgi:pimeloyl-ACP methyl ester carboxylesterase
MLGEHKRRLYKNIMNSIYKTAEGEKLFLNLYDQKLKKMGYDYEDCYLETSSGTTHVLITGKRDGVPLVFFHGGNSPTPYSLTYFTRLCDQFNIYAIDINGLPGKSSQNRIQTQNLGYGKWADEVLESIELENVSCLAVSFSGGILLSLAAYNPKRIKKAILVVPSGIVFGSIITLMFEMGLPLLRYRLQPNLANLLSVLKPYGPMVNKDKDFIEYCQVCFTNLKMAIPNPPLLSRADLQEFQAPTMIFAAGKDNLYPGAKLVAQAKYIIPNIYHIECFDNSTHYEVPMRDDVQQNIIDFINS